MSAPSSEIPRSGGTAILHVALVGAPHRERLRIGSRGIACRTSLQAGAESPILQRLSRSYGPPRWRTMWRQSVQIQALSKGAMTSEMLSQGASAQSHVYFARYYGVGPSPFLLKGVRLS